MFTASVIEAHLSTGTTLPLRACTAQKSGNRFWGIQQDTKDGKKFAGYGVNVPVSMTGEVEKIDQLVIKATDGSVVGQDLTVPVKHDKNEKGKPRVSGEREFTGADGEKWKVSFRATLTAEGIVNVKAAINRKSGGFGAPRVQSAL